MDWIKCSDKLPEDDKRFKNRKAINVLVTTQNRRVKKAQRMYNNYTNKWHWSNNAHSPIAWMYMPEPYKGE